MDIPREPKRKFGRYIYGALALLVVVLTTMGLQRLKPAAPTVDRSVIWFDQVKRGEFTRQVRGPGTLVPEQIRFVSALTAGRVERIMVEPGDTVDARTILLIMENPDVQQQLLDARRQLSSAEGQLVGLQSTLETQRLTQQGLVAQVRSQYQQALRQVQANEELAKRNLIAEIELQNSQDNADELEIRAESEQKRLDVLNGTMQEQVDAQRRQIESITAVLRFQEERVASMRVSGGQVGVVRDLPLEEGQWVTAGQTLARVVTPGKLKAELRIPETQARDIVLGQRALIDTRNDTIFGMVSRIDPAATNGAVTVDVRLEGELPLGARPDLTVDGTIELERVPEATFVGRPAYGQANSQVGLFKVTANAGEAVRVNVRLGRSSVQVIEIIEGLQVGDSVILSDMARWDAHERVRLR